MLTGLLSATMTGIICTMMVTEECTVLVAEYARRLARRLLMVTLSRELQQTLMTSFSMPVCPPSLIFKSDEFPAAETST